MPGDTWLHKCVKRKKPGRVKMILASELWFEDESLPVSPWTVFIFQLQGVAGSKKMHVIYRQSTALSFYIGLSFCNNFTIKIITCHSAIDKELVSICWFLALAGKRKQQAYYYRINSQ